MDKVLRVRKVMVRLASLALVIWFFLPLSKCTSAPNVENNVPAVDYYYSGLAMTGGYAQDIKKGQSEALVGMAAEFLIFFGPLASIRIRKPLRPILIVATSMLAAWTMKYLVFGGFATTTLPAGFLFAGCWAVLFFDGVIELFSWISICRRSRAGIRPSE